MSAAKLDRGTLERWREREPGAIFASLAPPPSTPADLVRYAAASGDTNPLHLDPAFAKKAGFARLVVHGMLSMAHMGRLLTDHFPAAAIRSFSARFTGVILVGEQIVYTASLSGGDGGHYTVVLEARDSQGVLVMSGGAGIDGRHLT